MVPTLDAAHRYWFGGQRLIGTTEALTAAGLIDARWFTPEGCARGTAVHEIAKLTVCGHLLGGVDQALRGYADAVDAACSALQLTPMIVEEPLTDGTSAGTPDVLGLATYANRRWRATIDWKSGGAAKWHALQTYNYEALGQRHARGWDTWAHLPRLRLAVYVRADGTFAFQPHNLTPAGLPDLRLDRHHQTVFLSALHVLAFRGAPDEGVPEHD